MACKSSKKKRIIDITTMLIEGMERREILQKLSKTYKVSPRTIDSEIKEAKVVIYGRNRETEEIRLRVSSQMTEEAVKQGLKSDLELELILSKIACAEVKVEEWLKGRAILREISPLEIIKAIEVLYKKRGSYAPDKHELSLKPAIDYSKLSDEVLSQLLEASN